MIKIKPPTKQEYDQAIYNLLDDVANWGDCKKCKWPRLRDCICQTCGAD